jgi:hypothetical protein
VGALRPRTHWRDKVKNLITVLNTARQPMTPEEAKGICLVLLRPLAASLLLAVQRQKDEGRGLEDFSKDSAPF